MKCSTIERWILMGEQPTHEMAHWRKRRIETHLSNCTGCRQWLEDYRKINVMAGTDLLVGEPSEQVLTTIRREARVRAAEPHPRSTGIMPPFVVRLFDGSLALRILGEGRAVRPSWGLATVVTLGLVLIGGWWLKPNPNGGFGSEAQLSTILLMLTEETVDLDSDTAPTPVDSEAIASLDALAERLLTLQGLDDTYTDAELSTPDEAHPATDPLTRSSAASRSEKYG